MRDAFIFDAIRTLEEKSQPFDAVTLSEALDNAGALEEAGGLAYLGRLAKETPTAANIVAYADIVRERSVLRQLIAVGTDIAQDGYSPDGRESRERLDNAENHVANPGDKKFHFCFSVDLFMHLDF